MAAKLGAFCFFVLAYLAIHELWFAEPEHQGVAVTTMIQPTPYVCMDKDADLRYHLPHSIPVLTLRRCVQ